MGSIINLGKHLVVAVLVTAVLWTALHAFLYLVSLGNIRAIRFTNRIRRSIEKAPANALFTCRNQAVSVTFYDPSSDEESTVTAWWYPPASELFPSLFLTWDGPSRSTATMRRWALVDLTFRSAIFLLFFATPMVIGLWLAFSVHWIWFCGVLYVLLHQAFMAFIGKFVYLKPGRCLGMVLSVFSSYAFVKWIGERLHLDWVARLPAIRVMNLDWQTRFGTLAVAVTVLGVLSMAVLAWVELREARA